MKTNRLAVALLDLRTNPSIELIGVFVCGLFIIGILINLLSSLITDFQQTVVALPVAFIILLALSLIAFFAYRRYEKRIKVQIDISEKSNVPPVKYVITALSPLQEFRGGGDNLDNIRRLLKHHLKAHDNALQELHVISVLKRENDNLVALQPTSESTSNVVRAYETLVTWLNENYSTVPIIYLHGVMDTNGAQETFNVLRPLLVKFANQGLKTEEVVVDVTAGTKAMAVGMTAAALVSGYPLSYQATKRDAEGQPDFTANFRDTSMVYLEVKGYVSLNK